MKSIRAIGLMALFSGLAGFSAWSQAFEYPTVERVEFVEACALNSPNRPHQEMVYKCSCLIDRFADQVNFDEFVELSTATKAYSIAGERGNAFRDSTLGKEDNKRYKQLLSEAKKSCLIQ